MRSVAVSLVLACASALYAAPPGSVVTAVAPGLAFSTGTLQVVPGSSAPGQAVPLLVTLQTADDFAVYPRHVLSLSIASPLEYVGQARVYRVCRGAAGGASGGSLDVDCTGSREGGGGPRVVRSSLMYALPKQMPKDLAEIALSIQFVDTTTGNVVQDLGKVVIHIAPARIIKSLSVSPSVAVLGDDMTLLAAGNTGGGPGAMFGVDTLVKVVVLRPPLIAGQWTVYPLCDGSGTEVRTDFGVKCPVGAGKDFSGRLAYRPPITQSLLALNGNTVDAVVYLSVVHNVTGVDMGGGVLRFSMVATALQLGLSQMKAAEKAAAGSGSGSGAGSGSGSGVGSGSGSGAGSAGEGVFDSGDSKDGVTALDAGSDLTAVAGFKGQQTDKLGALLNATEGDKVYSAPRPAVPCPDPVSGFGQLFCAHTR